MTSKNIPDRNKPAPSDKAAKGRDEIDSKDLDKVTGGARPSTIGNTREPLAGG
jgi:hypothetical protein